jgi:hypothetical protein
MKLNITKITLLGVCLAVGAAESIRAEARDRFTTNADESRFERVLDEASVRPENRVKDDSRPEGHELADRDLRENETLIATRRATDTREANSRGTPHESIGHRSKVARPNHREHVGTRSTPDEHARGTAAGRREEVSELAFLREEHDRHYREEQRFSRHMSRGSARSISESRPHRQDFALES